MIQADHKDAELILKLYDLRRETVMREARKFLMEFEPHSGDDVLAVALEFGSQNNAYLRQVLSYWEMAASFVNRGILNPFVFADNCGEGLFIYQKLEPYVAQVREALSPAFLQHMEEAITSHPVIGDRLNSIKEFAARLARSR